MDLRFWNFRARFAWLSVLELNGVGVEKEGFRVRNTLRQRGKGEVRLLTAPYFYTISQLLAQKLVYNGVYCATVREAAQEGRNQCDVVNYRLEKDLNTNLARATSARIQAERMRNGAKQCKAQLSPSTEAVFLPKDVIQKDAKIVLLDLEDGLASGSIHILAQKLEHAVQVMYDIQHLALTLADCREVYRASQQIVRACESALAARNWTEVKKGVNEAVERTKAIGALTCR